VKKEKNPAQKMRKRWDNPLKERVGGKPSEEGMWKYTEITQKRGKGFAKGKKELKKQKTLRGQSNQRETLRERRCQFGVKSPPSTIPLTPDKGVFVSLRSV